MCKVVERCLQGRRVVRRGRCRMTLSSVVVPVLSSTRNHPRSDTDGRRRSRLLDSLPGVEVPNRPGTDRLLPVFSPDPTVTSSEMTQGESLTLLHIDYPSK